MICVARRDGKEVFAQAIHTQRKKDKPLVQNCAAALPDTLSSEYILLNLQGALPGPIRKNKGYLFTATAGRFSDAKINSMPIHLK